MIKKSCIYYTKILEPDCKALNKLYCDLEPDKECKFYKNKNLYDKKGVLKDDKED